MALFSFFIVYIGMFWKANWYPCNQSFTFTLPYNCVTTHPILHLPPPSFATYCEWKCLQVNAHHLEEKTPGLCCLFDALHVNPWTILGGQHGNLKQLYKTCHSPSLPPQDRDFITIYHSLSQFTATITPDPSPTSELEIPSCKWLLNTSLNTPNNTMLVIRTMKHQKKTTNISSIS